MLKPDAIEKNGVPFWRSKTFGEMSDLEWESICDGCGKCCLHKLEDEETEAVLFTNISCKYLDLETCRCQVYSERKSRVENCLVLKPDRLEDLKWLPSTCSYRRLSEGKDLPEWHPLLSGDAQAVHAQHISVKGKALSENDVKNADWDQYIIDDL